MSSINSNITHIINDETGSFWFKRDYIADNKLFNLLLKQSIPEDQHDDSAFWKQREGELYEKSYLLRRLLRHMGDRVDIAIGYGGKSYPIDKWTPEINSLRIKLMKEFNVFLDFCLLNYYRDGMDTIAPHPDRESVGPRNITIGISLGSSRDFVIHRAINGQATRKLKASSKITNDDDCNYSYQLCKASEVNEKICRVVFDNHHGDLYCMEGAFHKNYVHSVPERKKIKEPRISLTFRQIIDDGYYQSIGLDTSNIEMMLEYLNKNKRLFVEEQIVQKRKIKIREGLII
jgi:alkylated DNA repair dioxygenase AlkB